MGRTPNPGSVPSAAPSPLCETLPCAVSRLRLRGHRFPPAGLGFSGPSRRSHRRPPFSGGPSGGRPGCRAPSEGTQASPANAAMSSVPRPAKRTLRVAPPRARCVVTALQDRARQGCGGQARGLKRAALSFRALRGGAGTRERGCCVTGVPRGREGSERSGSRTFSPSPVSRGSWPLVYG